MTTCAVLLKNQLLCNDLLQVRLDDLLVRNRVNLGSRVEKAFQLLCDASPRHDTLAPLCEVYWQLPLPFSNPLSEVAVVVGVENLFVGEEKGRDFILSVGGENAHLIAELQSQLFSKAEASDLQKCSVNIMAAVRAVRTRFRAHKTPLLMRRQPARDEWMESTPRMLAHETSFLIWNWAKRVVFSITRY